MQKIRRTTWVFGVVMCIAVLNCTKMFAQNCSVCVIDLACTITPAAPLLCPDTLPADTAQQYYEADVTFYLPETFDITDPVSATVTLNQIDVIGLTGLPVGMSWTSYDWTGNDTLSFYPPQNPPSSERGCARICGTPLMPGSYTITVSVKAYVDVGGNPYIQYPTFDVPLTILPSGSGNSVFTMASSQGCDSITTSFAPILQSGGDPLITYDWDFGDSTTSMLESPDHTYAVPGNYVVSMTMNIYEYVLTDVTVAAIGCGWAGDIEEPFCSSSPDLYFNYIDSASALQSTTVDDSQNPSWSNIGQVITGNSFSLEFWDEDLISQWDYLGDVTVSFSGAGVYSISNSEILGNVTIAMQLDTTYTDTDTVRVYPSPLPTPTIVSPNDSICSGDSITMITGGGEYYQWYEDTNLIVNATDSFYTTYQSGKFWVEIASIFGCIATTDTIQVYVFALQGIPGIANLGGNKLQTFSNPPNMQWYLDGDTIPGATQTSIQITQSGYYHITTTNILGCVTSSDTVFVTYVGVDNLAAIYGGISVYPNPSSGNFDLTLTIFDSQLIQTKIIDISGRVLYDHQEQYNAGDVKMHINIADLNVGIYLLNIIIGEHSVIRKIVIR